MKNEYRGLLAVALSAAVLFVWYTFIAPPPHPTLSPAPTAITQRVADTSKASIPSPLSPPTPTTVIVATVVRKKGEEVQLENDQVKITLDTMGGVLTNWELKRFLNNGKDASKPVVLAESNGNTLDIEFRNANFEVSNPIPFEIVKKGEKEVDLRWSSKSLTIWKRIRLAPNAYQASLELELANNKKETLAFVPAIDWTKIAIEESPQRGILFFKSPPDKWHPIYYKEGSLTVLQGQNIPSSQVSNTKISWAGAESRYFLGGIIPVGTEAEGLETGHTLLPTGEEQFFAKLLLPQVQVLPGDHWLQKFDLYGGPKDLKNLKAVGSTLKEAIGYGWTTVVATPILFLLRAFYKVVHNYGIAIILLTILIKLLLNPINRKSLQSMKSMQALQPKLKELREKYGKDKERMNLETMQLFKSHKVNPMGGCLPMLLQFPIYIALYKVLWTSVELYHAPFFWFYKDLSAPDPYLITPVLLGITMFIQTKMTPNPSADPAQQKMMLIMPLMFSGFMIFLPMGLVLYILVNTGMTILQQWMYQRGIRFRDLLKGNYRASAGAR